MKLVHFSAKPIGKLEELGQEKDYSIKPNGFWLSDQDAENNWLSWCRSEGFGLDRFKFAIEVELTENHNVLTMSKYHELINFSQSYKPKPQIPYVINYNLDWRKIASIYNGVIVSPYIWAARLNLETAWYYSWDCASGVIFNPSILIIKQKTIAQQAALAKELAGDILPE